MQVLCFDAYFQEAVHEKREEQYRIRRYLTVRFFVVGKDKTDYLSSLRSWKTCIHWCKNCDSHFLQSHSHVFYLINGYWGGGGRVERLGQQCVFERSCLLNSSLWVPVLSGSSCIFALLLSCNVNSANLSAAFPCLTPHTFSFNFSRSLPSPPHPTPHILPLSLPSSTHLHVSTERATVFCERYREGPWAGAFPGIIDWLWNL